MTVFLLLAATLTVAVVARLLWPLWRAPGRGGVSVAQLNSTVYRDQLRELERDLARGQLDEAAYREARDELQRRLLVDVDAAPGVAPAAASPARWTAMALVLLVPLGAAGVYAQFGNAEAISGERQAVAPENVRVAVAKLAEALRQNPDNPEGWLLLARTYRKMERFAESAEAYERAGALVAQSPDLLVEQADVLTAASNDELEGRPMDLVRRAIALEPKHPMALMLMGTSAYRRADFAAAVNQWETLLGVLPSGSPEAAQVQANIDQARREGNLPAQAVGPAAQAGAGAATGTGTGTAPAAGTGTGLNTGAGSASAGAAPRAGAASGALSGTSAGGAAVAGADARPSNGASGAVSGEVSMTPAIAAQLRPDDVLFIVARPDDGSRAPVAVLRKRVADLPLTFVLDDSLAMMPERTVSKARGVVVVARVSRSGQPVQQPGDFTSAPSAPVPPGSTGLRLSIDRQL